MEDIDIIKIEIAKSYFEMARIFAGFAGMLVVLFGIYWSITIGVLNVASQFAMSDPKVVNVSADTPRILGFNAINGANVSAAAVILFVAIAIASYLHGHYILQKLEKKIVAEQKTKVNT